MKPAPNAGKQHVAARAMVAAIFTGSIRRIFIATSGADHGAGMMEAFWREWNLQMPWRDMGDFAALVDRHGHILQQ